MSDDVPRGVPSNDGGQGMKGKLVVITGASSGIGRATAEGLATRGASLALVGRDIRRLSSAAEAIRKAAPVPVHTYIADLSSMAEVRRVASEIGAAHPRIDVLINNAGTVGGRRRVTVDGYEHTFALDHLSPFLLTNLLLPSLKASAPSRIVTVSSVAHFTGSLHLDDLMMENGYSAWRAYSQAKLANVMFTYELARRLQGTGVTANCAHPGVVRSRFGQEASGLLHLGLVVLRPFSISARQGARTIIYLASSPQVEGVSGRYFAAMRPRQSSPASCDQRSAERLWEASEALTGLTPR